MGTQGAPLYQSTGAGSNAGPQVAAPVTPGKPLDVAQMEALNRRVQAFKVAGSPVDPQDLKDGQKHFQAATDALKAGDYKKAESELSALGFPLPAAGGQLSNAATVSAVLLGTPVRATGGGGWQTGPITVGARGNQALNDMNGYAANAAMINRLASAPGGVSNPPTEAQVTQYMRDLANPPKGQPQPTAQQVMEASSEITNGMIMHYSSAGRGDPVYNANPTPRAFYRDSSGTIHEFTSVADAQKAAKAKPAATRRSHPAPSSRGWTRTRPTSGATCRRKARRVRAATSATARASCTCRRGCSPRPASRRSAASTCSTGAASATCSARSRRPTARPGSRRTRSSVR